MSATDRAIQSLTGFDTLGAVQTDAAINQGNSGGPLLDADGEVIGINAQIRTRSGGGEGVGYAIPVDQVRRSLDQIREGGKVRYAYLGVATTAVYPQLAERFDLGTTTGAWVQEVVKGGPAEKAGLQGRQRRDALPGAAVPRRAATSSTKVGDTPVRTENDLGLALTQYKPGDEVTLEIFRDGKRADGQVKARRAARRDRAASLAGSTGSIPPPMLQPVAVGQKTLADYTHIVGRPLIEEIRELAEPLKGSRVVHLSATAFGGGVAEILYTLIPLMKDVGLDVEWQVIYGREEFFNATKLMHNALQGAPEDLSPTSSGTRGGATTR